MEYMGKPNINMQTLIHKHTSIYIRIHTDSHIYICDHDKGVQVH